MSHYTNNLFDPKAKNNSWVHLFDFVPQGSRVLDVGCSSGNFGEVLIKEKQCEVVGLDIDKPDVAKAAKKLTAAHVRNIEQDDITDLGQFDVIVFADVLEHLFDPITALEKVKQQLKKGGRIVFSIPNMAHISVRLQLLEGFFEYTPIGVLDRTHLHYYDELEVRQIFNQSGLAIKEINPTTWTYPVSVLSERFLQMGLAIHNKELLQKKLEDTKANVWQFVGFATPSNKKIAAGRPIKYGNPPEELHSRLIARDDELRIIGQRLQVLEQRNRQMEEFYRNPIKGIIERAARKLKRFTD